ncbi:aminotransferase [Aspergillus sclerotioniger CBS 115572]|uniref:Aminotransferase n=1 Tax=Aspergillus sclerotioniger CBS 115572 TaxID=1450535 RepID=A0A317V7G1_9EURO|nr:aminotransferase [Aspergillus sclerotioniger CBS 115572]PWY70304.1 aminotransferase [Aspergillus sclerotioniger CBS 115572]
MWDIMRNPWCPLTNPTGYVNVGVAENALMHDYLLSYMNTQLTLPAKYLTYNDGAIGAERLRRAMAAFLTKHLHPVKPLTSDNLLVTNGVSSAIEHMSWAFTDPGEGILLGRPYYGTFIPDMSVRPGAVVVGVEFGDVDPFSMDAVECYEKALVRFQETTGKKVRAVMLCHPHNPLGRCYPRQTIVGLMRLCQKYQIHLISDEIYALSVWENTIDEDVSPVGFESALSIDMTGIIDPSLVHLLWGMSKDFGANGIRLGVIISQSNPVLLEAVKGVSLYTYSSSVSEHLAAVILEDEEFTTRYIRLNRQRMGESYAFAAGYLKDCGIEYATGANAAFFLWVNLGRKYCELHPEMGDLGDGIGDKVMEVLLQRKVFLASGGLFGSERSGWFRIVFTHERGYLEEALRRVVLALHD